MGHLHGRLRRPRVWAGVGAVTQWFLPLFRTVACRAPLRDHRGPAQVSALVAALPTLWPLADLLWVRDFVPSDTAYVVAAAVPAWASALALCAAHHRDAPPAALPAGAPGLVFAACCALLGGSVVALPGADTVWALVTCYLVTAPAWLLYRVRGESRVPAGEAAALAALGLLLLAVRITAVRPWLDLLPGALASASSARRRPWSH
ncbi:hypothetical protein ACIQJT_04015 [Streptomyces sp. NPDC091972]|uniref:hypothetical protein n=1 Tax=Streptomyces sp. NPDC091972 TaxID=3366007 RepID=UPI00382C0C84